MPNLLTTGADWLADQQKEHCGTQYQYDRNGLLLDVVLVPDVRRDQQRSDAPEDDAILSRTTAFHAKAEDLAVEVGGSTFLPVAGHRIRRDNDCPEEYVVFPSFSQQVYKFTDPSRTILRIYAVAIDELECLTITAIDAKEFTVLAIASEIRGDLAEQGTNLVKVMRQTVHIPTKLMIDNGVTELQRNMNVATARYADWSIDLSQSRWGAGRVTLELIRNPIAALKNMERNAAV